MLTRHRHVQYREGSVEVTAGYQVFVRVQLIILLSCSHPASVLPSTIKVLDTICAVSISTPKQESFLHFQHTRRLRMPSQAVMDIHKLSLTMPCTSSSTSLSVSDREKALVAQGSLITLPLIESTSPNDNRSIAWLQCIGSFFLFFNCWGTVNSFGVYFLYAEN